MTYAGECRKCGGTTFQRYTHPDGEQTDVCTSCRHARPGDVTEALRKLHRPGPPAKPSLVCHICDARVLDSTCCKVCWSDVGRALRKIPWLERELDVTITRQTRFSDQAERVKGTAETPTPFGVAASDARATLRAVLVGWVKMVHEEMGATG